MVCDFFLHELFGVKINILWSDFSEIQYIVVLKLVTITRYCVFTMFHGMFHTLGNTLGTLFL